jgi:cytidylate kinase
LKGSIAPVSESTGSPELEPLVIAIDGPAGAGKSTVAAMLARRLGLPYLDTGAMYRAVAWLALREGVGGPDLADSAKATVASLLDHHSIDLERADDGVRVVVDGRDVGSELRTPEVAMMASAVSALPEVRRRLVAAQREIGLREGGVLEGRDMTSVVFPDATLRVFLTADADERARRRFGDLEGTGAITLDQVRQQQRQRDRQDTTRADSPLHVANGVVVVDTSGLTPEQVVARLLEELERVAPQDP